jgi:hypothetical protein
MNKMNKVWAERENFKILISENGDRKDESFRERLRLNANAKDEIQISPVGETFVEEISLSLFEKYLRKRYFESEALISCLVALAFFYFAKKQENVMKVKLCDICCS